MSLEAVARLEELVDQLLAERIELQKHNQVLAEERDRLVDDRVRVSNELDQLLNKLEKLEGKGP